MEFEIKSLPMISGRAEAVERKYRKVECSAGVYLIAIQPACADHVYFHNPKDKNSDGFGGATLDFPLVEDGGVYSAKGPWKCSASYLKKDCGIDIEDKYSTFLVVGKGYRSEKGGYMGRRFITDVIHQDADWQVSRFEREVEFISSLPPGRYHYYIQTYGGSRSGSLTPEEAAGKCVARQSRSADSRFALSAEQRG